MSHTSSMGKRQFLEAMALRCATIPGAQTGFTVFFAVQMWEAIEKYGEMSSEQISALISGTGQGLTGPRSPLS